MIFKLTDNQHDWLSWRQLGFLIRPCSCSKKISSKFVHKALVQEIRNIYNMTGLCHLGGSRAV